MKYFKLRKKFIYQLVEKFKNDYGIYLSWRDSPYIKFKYIYICEIAAFFSYFFFYFNIKPNIITYLNIILAIIASIFFLIGETYLQIISLIIFFSKNILDNVDGFIAREKNLSSRFGASLDKFSGVIYYYSFLTSLIVHNYYLLNEKIILFSVILFLFLDLTNFKIKRNLNKINYDKKNITFKKILYILKSLNYDGRTKITDITILVIIFELFSNLYVVSTFLIILFLILKIIRNLYYLTLKFR